MWSLASSGFSQPGRWRWPTPVYYTYSNSLEVIEVKPRSKRPVNSQDTGGLHTVVGNPCVDWSVFEKLLVVVASAQALAEMNDADCTMFWRVLSAPRLQQLIVWNDVRTPQELRRWGRRRFKAMFRGFVEAAIQCPEFKLRRLHLPLFHAIPNENVYNYPRGVLARA